MKDETIAVWNDPEVEVRIVAMVLGEASDFEKSELERMIAEDSGLKQFHLEMNELHGGIHAAVQPDDDAEWKLSTERRNRVLGKLGQQPEPVAPAAVQMKPSTSHYQWRSFISIAACLLVTLFIMAVMFPGRVMKNVRKTPEIISYSAAPSELRREDVTVAESNLGRNFRDESSDDPFADDSDLQSMMEDLDEKEIISKPESSMAKVIASNSSSAAAVPVPDVEITDASLNFGNGDDFGDGFGDGWGSSVENGLNIPGVASDPTSGVRDIISGGNRSGDYAITRDNIDSFFKKPIREKGEEVDSLVKQEIASRTAQVQKADSALLEGRKLYAEGKFEEAEEEYKDILRVGHYNTAARRGLEKIAGLKSDYYSAAYDQTRAELLMQVDKAWEIGVAPREEAKSKKKSAERNKSDKAAQKWKFEQSEAQKKKPMIDEISATEQTHSTFSLNVSDASYKLAKAALLERGERPAAESVRTEEFINAFDYGDPKPSMAQKVACVQEQAIHPFLQQRNLLRVSMSTAAQGRSTPLNIVILLDQSGSMERPDRAATVLHAMEEIGKQLGANDRVSLMSFARNTRLLVDDLSGDRAGELVNIIKNRPSEGGTNLEQAVQVAQRHLLARQKKGVQSRIVVLTDGAANLGDANPQNLTAMVEKMRDAGIAFDACGIGFDGLDDGILEALTRKGDGRYYVLDKPEDVDESFGEKIAGALRPAAKNVKVQLVFNPDRVGKYKLLGFEKHRLNKEDFRNDAVDAAEMAAEESGSALYQIEAMADGSGEIGTVFVRFQDMETGQMVERSWMIPYQQNTLSLEASKPSVQLAAVAGLLGEKLHQSDAGSVDFSQMNKVLGNLSSQYSGNKKVQELLQMVRKVQQ